MSVEFKGSTDRDKLLNRVIKPMNELEAAEEELNRIKHSVEPLKRAKIPMVNNRRSKFVDSALVPPVRTHFTVAELIAREKKALDDKIVGAAESTGIQDIKSDVLGEDTASMGTEVQLIFSIDLF